MTMRKPLGKFKKFKFINFIYLNIIILICFKLCILYKLFERFPDWFRLVIIICRKITWNFFNLMDSFRARITWNYGWRINKCNFRTREIIEKRETSLPEKNVKTVNLKHNFIVICLGNLNSSIFNLYNLSYQNYQSICNYIHKYIRLRPLKNIQTII